MDYTSLKEIAGAVSGVSALVIGGRKLLLHFQAKASKLREKEAAKLALLHNVADAIARIEPALTDVQRQLQTNGGSTLRDVVNDIRNEHAVERAARRVMSNVASFEVIVNPVTQAVHVLFVSPAYIKLTGLTRDDCEHDGWIRAVVASDRDRVAMLAREALEEGFVISTRYTVEHVYTHARTPVDHTGTPVLNFRGELVGWIGILTPVEDA